MPCNVGLTCSLWWLLNRQQRNRNQHRDFTIATLWEAILAARYPRLVFGSRLCFCLILMCVKLSLVGLFTTNPFMCQLHLTLHLIANPTSWIFRMNVIFPCKEVFGDVSASNMACESTKTVNLFDINSMKLSHLRKWWGEVLFLFESLMTIISKSK